MMELSAVLSVYNEEENLKAVYEGVKKALSVRLDASHEIIFVDDGSRDGSWDVIKALAQRDPAVKGLRFSRNFGQQYALKAGMEYSAGSAVITMDSDMQHPPEVIGRMVEEWEKGAEIVNAVRRGVKNSGFFKSLTSKAYYSLIRTFSEVKIPDGSSDFRLLDRKVVDEINAFSEYYVFLRGLVNWVGFRTASVEYLPGARHGGKTKYTLGKMFGLAVSGIMSFSIQPLRLAMITAGGIFLVAFAYIGFILHARLVLKATVPGWTAIAVSVLFMGGIQLLFTGIVGEYVGRIFLEGKRRPRYIVTEKI